MRALIQKLSPVQEAAVITTIFVGWFIFSALLIAVEATDWVIWEVAGKRLEES